MSEKKERVFAEGFSFKRNESAPDYVVGRLSLKVDDAVAFIKKHANTNGWVNLTLTSLLSKMMQCLRQRQG
jgi:hypothetical protein